jgi:hypothetical protein
MKVRTIGVLSFVGVAMSITPIWAGSVGLQRSISPGQQQATLAQLEAQQEQVSRNALAANVKGPQLLRSMDKQAQLQDLINRIQSGQPVSPDEIDHALQPTNP